MDEIFITRYATTTREVRSYNHVDTEIVDGVDGVDGVIEYLRQLASDRRSVIAMDKLDIFRKPRLCEKCLEHASQPLMFDVAKVDSECLCKIKKTPCGVHP